MATRTFSGRAEAAALDYANALTQSEHGMSYGQYCSSILLDSITSRQQLPQFPAADSMDARRKEAYEFIRSFDGLQRNEAIGSMDDDQIRDLIASRYE